MSVRSRGRCVLHPAPLTSRKLRSPQDLNRPRPLARPTPSGPPRRSMFASTIRPVRHSIPLSLSIVARPHEAGLIRSWKADSLAFVWLDLGITPCCKSLFASLNTKFPSRTRGDQTLIWGTALSSDELTGDFGNGLEATSIGDCGS